MVPVWRRCRGHPSLGRRVWPPRHGLEAATAKGSLPAPARGGHTPSSSTSLRVAQRQHGGPQSGDRRRASPKSSKPRAGAPGTRGQLDPSRGRAPGSTRLALWLAVAVAVPRPASRQRLQRGRNLGGRHEADALHLLPKTTAETAMATRGHEHAGPSLRVRGGRPYPLTRCDEAPCPAQLLCSPRPANFGAPTPCHDPPLLPPSPARPPPI